ncbi:4-hydroxybenzoate polyprenyltransferase [Bifidobacterium sp. 82T24]|uniref:4-hydroxybenzoate polyprenyltransferase n=1 Tax=Bifidobacterium pluvialisilvae TaxID=2834436 RepID=UPI001C56DC40|nr:4-hydroxybenzoate polyprenyltransferase [Bifidobacterium pluvialisilvae]MBW3087880.1 4-hydroxybenzoate polyprenyltransferase [Bifidobacterium pluvialisilvae]
MTQDNRVNRESKSAAAVPDVREDSGPVPLMLAQAIIMAAVMCLCEIVCAPMIISMAGGAFALVPWATLACLLAVVFVLILGFAFLWLADNLSHNFPAKMAPVTYGVVGAASFGVWGGLIYPTFMNSILKPAGLAELTSGDVWAIGFNCAVIGLVAFLLAVVYGPRLAKRRSASVAIGVVVLVLAAFGAFFLWRFMARLY